MPEFRRAFGGRTFARTGLLNAVEASADRTIAEFRAAHQLRARDSYYGSRAVLSSSEGGEGERRFLLFENILESGYGETWLRAVVQKEFHNLISAALRKALLGEDYLRIGPLLARMRGWPRYNPTVLCRAPRRFGKSVGVAMFVAALAEAVQTYPLKKRYRITVFSTGGRISDEMSKYVIDFLEIRGCKFHKSQRFNVKIQLSARTPGASPPVEIDFYPSNPRFLRGVNSDCLIVDEAAHIDLALWQEVISPIFGMTETVLVMISSPLGYGNFFSRLLDLRFESGVKVFNSYAPDLICARCRASGNKEVMKKCRHRLHLLPRWKSEEKMDAIEVILGKEVEIYMRENFGEIVERGGSHFTEAVLDRFLAIAPIKPDSSTSYPKFVLLALDPSVSDGSTSSEMALCALARIGQVTVICGIASFRTADGEKVKQFLKFFVNRLRAVPCLRDSWILFCGERGTGHDSSFLLYDLKNYEKRVMGVNGKSRSGTPEFGWWTNQNTKVSQLELATNMLQVDAVGWLDGWVFENGFTNVTREEAVEDFRAQLFRYGIYEFVNGASKRIRVSGQVDENGRIAKTLRDDKAVVFCLACGIMRAILSREVEGMDYSRLF